VTRSILQYIVDQNNMEGIIQKPD